MNIISIDSLEPDKEKLLLFLNALKDEAEDDAHAKYASISIQTSATDPLSVLQTIYEEDEHHYYMERPEKGVALMAAESVALFTGSGASRFSDGQAFADEVMEHMTLVGDLEAPYSGPTFWVAYGFADSDADSPFPEASIFLPHWQVARHSDGVTAVANICVEEDSDLEALAERLLAAYAKFDDLDKTVAVSDHKELGNIEPDVSSQYCAAVAKGVSRIRNGRYDKIVLARQHSAKGDFHPVDILNRLRNRFPECCTFSFSSDAGRSFIGATPEHLLSVSKGVLQTMAIAGTAARGATSEEDKTIGNELLSDPKEQQEHGFVVESICSRLQKLSLTPEVGECALLPLKNVQHLKTPISASVDDSIHPLRIAQELHPTPAVGGKPRETSVPDIAELENMSRGLYAGFSGWFNWKGDAEFIVGLRSAYLEKNLITAYAGAGIVSDSDPIKEERETRLKLQAILNSLA
jgi:menaquinone-specific isochorismate synthase